MLHEASPHVRWRQEHEHPLHASRHAGQTIAESRALCIPTGCIPFPTALTMHGAAETGVGPKSGGPFRPMHPSPGLVQQIGFRLFWHPDESIAPVRIDHQMHDGEMLRPGSSPAAAAWLAT